MKSILPRGVWEGGDYVPYRHRSQLMEACHLQEVAPKVTWAFLSSQQNADVLWGATWEDFMGQAQEG